LNLNLELMLDHNASKISDKSGQNNS